MDAFSFSWAGGSRVLRASGFASRDESAGAERAGGGAAQRLRSPPATQPRGASAGLVCSVARAARGRTSLIALRRRLPALPHHASAGRVARAAGQAREPAAAGRVASSCRCRSRLSSGAAGGPRRVRLLPLVRKRPRAQSSSDPRKPPGEARLHAGAEHHRPGAAASATRSHGAVRAPAASPGGAERRAGAFAHLHHAHRAGRLPRSN